MRRLARSISWIRCSDQGSFELRTRGDDALGLKDLSFLARTNAR
jgi:hypothetical protein